MNKRNTALILALLMLIGHLCIPGMEVSATGEQNRYGHAVTYSPITQLRAGGRTVRFFDAGMTAWGQLEDKTRQSEDSAISWLTKEGYLLNRFGRQTKGANLKESLAANGEWQTKLRSSNRNVKSWNATIGFDALTTASGRENGNIANMYDKGDLEYLFSWKVYTVKTSWWFFGTSNDKGDTTIFGETKKSSGDGWNNYNTYGNGGPNLGDDSAWHSANKLSTLYFTAFSDQDNEVDSYLSGAMLVGRDIKGPQISSVKVTSDEDGEKTIPGGAITLDTIDSALTNRTVYFHVTWDEPVVFQNMSRQAIAGLSLLINTEGIDKSTAQTAEAAFLRFAPSKNDAKPVMVFEYQLPDPYTDPGAQERGYYYRFKNVTVSSSENAAFWNNIYDLSGNKFAADKDGVQPSKQMRVAIDGAPYVDLRPFGIESIRVTPDRTTRIADENSAFLEAGRVFVVTLTLNKTLRNGVSNMDLPSLTLNVKDAEGNFVTISPSEEYLKRVEKNKSGAWEPTDKYVWIGNRCVKPVMLWDNQRISYYIQLYPGYTMDGDSIRVTAVTADKSKVKDDAGYSMMDYALEENFLSPTDIPEGARSMISQYQVAPDRQYKLDFDPPEITVNAENPDGNGVVMISAAVTDPSLAGTDASFTVKVNGNFSDDVPVQYQAASSESYNDASWISADTGVSSAAFSTPVMQGADSTEGTAYGFIKLPQPGEADTLDVSVTVTDEAGNSATKTETITTSYDILAPRIDAKVIGEEVSFEISDIDDSITYYYGYSENDAAEPDYTNEYGKSGTLPLPQLPNDNEVYSRVVWIKASDSSGNVSGIIKLPVKFDRTYTTIDYTADTSKTYLAEDYPTVEATIENVTGYWYMWAEKPAGVADTAAYISDRFIADMKSYAESLNQVKAVADEDPDTEQSNNATNIAPALSGTSAVAKINPEDESYDGTIYAEDTSRPIMLIIAAEKDDGTTLVKTVEFDTFYSAPAVNVTQSRFSTNNHKGKRVDYTVGDQTLLMANDTTYSYPLNTPSLYGFAQAELRIALDPVTGLDRVDLGGSTVTLERVVYEGEDLAASEVSRETLNTWTFTELGFNENVNTVIADIDPAIIDASYYEQYSVDENSGYRRPVRYELVCNMQYTGDIPSVRTPITYYAFNNTPEAYLYEIRCDVGEYTALANGLGAYENQNVEAVFDSDENDITANVPLYTAQTKDYEGTEGYKMYLKFTTNGNSGDACIGDKVYYGAPVQNTVDPENTAKLLLHIGTDPDNLTEIPFSSTQYYIESGTYDISEYLLGKGDAVSEVKLYYRFEHPERGEMSPLYVMNVRTDNEPPVFDITVSETERMTNEVSVKLHSVYDVQTLPDGTVYYDTEQPTDEWFSEGGTPELYAWRKATENDDAESLLEIGDAMPIWTYDEATDTETITDYYIRVRPDEEGFYRFTRNGFFAVNAVDNAENYTTSVLINGEPAELEFLGDKLGSIFEFNGYLIDNIDHEPPQFISDPTFTAGDGMFNVSAEVDNTAVRAYIRFDEAYSKLLAPNEMQEQDMYAIESVPGFMTGSFNKATGEINAEIYVKYSDTVPLTAATLVIEDEAGNITEYEYNFADGLYGKQAEVTNTKNENGYPVWEYGNLLTFSVPVWLDGTGDESYAVSYNSVPIYSDGLTQIVYTDLFGETYSENVLADIYGVAFAHKLIFTANGNEITPQTKVAADVTVTVDTSGTEGLAVDGGTAQFTLSDNGVVSYSLTNSGLCETRSYSVPVTNIDKIPPEALVTVALESETNPETGEVSIYSATYSIEGFSEEGVTMIPSEDGAAPMYAIFSSHSEEMNYTFQFRDEAGNEGSYIVDASEIAFAERIDTVITDYRLTYMAPNSNGYRSMGIFTSGETIDIGLSNSAVSVKVEALNQNGETVPAVVEASGALPDGAAVYAKEKLVMFTTESSADKTVNLTMTGGSNSISVPVMLPANTIDMTAPTGTVNYSADGNMIKAYLVTSNTDIAQVALTGTKSDGTPLVLGQDENGYYTEFDVNGTGQFVMLDHAGNAGTVSIAVLTIDTDAPEILAEGWQSHLSARDDAAVKELLQTPTNSTIKLFITFNEQLSRAEAKAYRDAADTDELTPTDDYITATASGNALTVEFKQNCLAMLTVYDLRGNAMTIWRPEDGPITVIDRDVPKPAEGYPKRTAENNTVKIEYVFADGEEVMRLDDHESGYQNSHTVTFTENGANILTFADRAGNVYSDYPVISEIDDTAPGIKISVDYVGDGAELSGDDSYKAGNLYTSKDVRILLNIEDGTNDAVTVTARTHSGKALEVNKEQAELNGKTYNYNIIVAENGSYRITAADQWGNETFVDTSVSVIDRTPPTIRLANSAVNVKAGTGAAEAERIILADITAADTQSGANAPMGDRFGEVTDGVHVSIDMSGIDLDRIGAYNAKVTATDRLGNTAEKDVKVLVVRDVYIFNINGASVYANDVFTASKGRITIRDANADAKYYYSRGYKTAAQMKYAESFEPAQGFDASQSGYYTILAQESGRGMHLLYVYVN